MILPYLEAIVTEHYTIARWRSFWRALTWAFAGSRPGVEYEMARLRGFARGGEGQGGRCDD